MVRSLTFPESVIFQMRSPRFLFLRYIIYDVAAVQTNAPYCRASLVTIRPSELAFRPGFIVWML